MRLIIISIIFLFLYFQAISQVEYLLTLNQTLELAHLYSDKSKKIILLNEINQLNFKVYKGSLGPTIGLKGLVPDFNRSISAQYLPDGTQDFISYDNWNTGLGLSLNQPIQFTGGELFIQSGIQRIVNIGQNQTTSFLTNPISIGFKQSLTDVNLYQWKKRIEQHKKSQNSLDILFQLENLSFETIGIFFDLLISQNQLDREILNQVNLEQINALTKGRYRLGQITEDEILQLELLILQSKNNFSSMKLNFGLLKSDFIKHLKLNHSEFYLVAPDLPETVNISQDLALKMLYKNNVELEKMKSESMEAEMSIATARAAKNIQLNLSASFGLNQTSMDIENAYKDPLDKEQFRLEFAIPIFDGKEKNSHYKIAISNREILNLEINNRIAAIENRLITCIEKYNLASETVNIYAKADTISTNRYEISKKRYQRGFISLKELNEARLSKEESSIKYLMSLKEYWLSYYELRMLTLYDYIKEIDLTD